MKVYLGVFYDNYFKYKSTKSKNDYARCKNNLTFQYFLFLVVFNFDAVYTVNIYSIHRANADLAIESTGALIHLIIVFAKTYPKKSSKESSIKKFSVSKTSLLLK